MAIESSNILISIPRGLSVLSILRSSLSERRSGDPVSAGPRGGFIEGVKFFNVRSDSLHSSPYAPLPVQVKTLFKSKAYKEFHPHGIAFALKSVRSFVCVATLFKEPIMKNTVRIRKKESGFSLIELLVIIVIVAILAAIAIPGFSAWLPNYRLRQASRDVYSNLQRAKVNAIKSNSEWRVYFDIPGGRYFLCSGPGADGNWNNPPAMGGDDDVNMTFDLSTYQDVDFGNGSAAAGIDGWVFGAPISYANPVTNFTSRGTVDLTGYVYLSNNKGSVIGVGTPSPAGVIVLRRFNGAVWE